MPRRSDGAPVSSPERTDALPGITRITVGGFKSIAVTQEIEVRPLTILAGANSSGKSSMMQPVLLLKQTLEATYDPGPLLLAGPNVAFTSVDQFLSVLPGGRSSQSFQVTVTAGAYSIGSRFGKGRGRGLLIEETQETLGHWRILLEEGSTHEQISGMLGAAGRDLIVWSASGSETPEFTITRSRPFLRLGLRVRGPGETPDGRGVLTVGPWGRDAPLGGDVLGPVIRDLIHLPGLRGNPERTYPNSAVGPSYPGTFEKYAASVIAQWQANGQGRKLSVLEKGMETLGLTWCVQAAPVNDTQVELKVGRLPHGRRNGQADLVSIADVGFGVSQTLPVLVALLAAEPGQAVYLEQPEIHLHPRAQIAMAEVLADAAVRGVRVIAETHSSLLLLGIQSLVAEGRISPDLVKLHWFERGENGATQVRSADLDESGAFGDWPVDFGDVALLAESRYLDAAEARERRAPRARTRVPTARS